MRQAGRPGLARWWKQPLSQLASGAAHGSPSLPRAARLVRLGVDVVACLPACLPECPVLPCTALACRYTSKQYFDDVHRTSQPYLAFKVGG